MAADSIKTAAYMARNIMGFNYNNRFAFRKSFDVLTCREIVANNRRNRLIKNQTLKVAEHAEYGSDIAVARFVLRLHGRVKTDNKSWITSHSKLPDEFTDSFKLTAIELTKSSLVTEGIDNFVGLDYLESLNLRESILLDNFACDQLGRQFRTSKSLKAIDISQIPYITVHGLEALLRIPSLRKICASGTQASKFEDIDLFALAAQDECDCKVLVHHDGRQFKLQDLEELYTDKTIELEAGGTRQLVSGQVAKSSE